LAAVANRYASQQREPSSARVWLDAVSAAAPMTSLVTGLGLGAVGYFLQDAAIAASGALAGAIGLYVERHQARALRRRRRAERMRSRHEVTELRRTIALLRQDVDAFQRALLDTEAALAARALPLLVPVVPLAEPPAPPADEEQLAVVPLADVEADEWVQTAVRDVAADAPLPAQRPSPFVVAVSGSLPVVFPAPGPHADAHDADGCDAPVAAPMYAEPARQIA